ncbi:hypothetical protein KCP76_14545 [Salmonella enterica subsp. enterica serovar Weltevreden]|nr:hypothetical protein KCP76_14545 [Salmonella enterica subsp. enterica serovar Weltevreden]
MCDVLPSAIHTAQRDKTKYPVFAFYRHSHPVTFFSRRLFMFGASTAKIVDDRPAEQSGRWRRQAAILLRVAERARHIARGFSL